MSRNIIDFDPVVTSVCISQEVCGSSADKKRSEKRIIITQCFCFCFFFKGKIKSKSQNHQTFICTVFYIYMNIYIQKGFS